MLPGDAMNVDDVARYLNLGRNTVYQMAKTGKLASYRVGRKLRFAVEDVEAYLDASHHPAMAGAAGGAVETTNAAEQEPLSAAAADVDASVSEAAAFGVVGTDPMRIAGNDVVADVLASSLNTAGCPAMVLRRESYTALVNLYAGDADAAIVNLYDHRSNSYNIPYVLGLAPGTSVVVVRLCRRSTGLIVAEGNPHKLTTWGALLREGVRMANRTKGSGARVLLDEKLRAMDARSESIEGYAGRPAVGSKAVERVAAGLADVTVGVQREADRVKGVRFIPLQDEWVDVVVAKNARTRAFIKVLEELAQGDELRVAIESLPGHDATRLGSITFEN